MLKWTVNGPFRQSYLPTVGEDVVTATNITTTTRSHNQDYTIRRRSTTAAADASTARRRSLPTQSDAVRKLRRKSSDIYSLRKRLHVAQDKENHMTSTPLPMGLRTASPLRKLGSLKDLSNITPEKFSSTLLSTPKRIESIEKPLPQQYASTLPTFDVEYSPCALVPGPILALRGVGIADNYFEKPRYLTHEFKELNQREEKRARMSTTAPPVDEESSLSSSKMGDLTLERMIDAILESARKDRKVPKSKQTIHHRVMSPTYTPADDPASDLHEFWDSKSEKYQQEQVPLFRDPHAIFNEREVRTPEVFDNGHQSNTIKEAVTSCQLRRQRAVRRKRKLNDLKTSVKNSAQKLLNRKSCGDRLDSSKEFDSQKTVRNVSPDSGRNSSSDFEDSNLESRNYTKRRLSFTANDLMET